jgi:hypothetical protein
MPLGLPEQIQALRLTVQVVLGLRRTGAPGLGTAEADDVGPEALVVPAPASSPDVPGVAEPGTAPEDAVGGRFPPPRSWGRNSSAHHSQTLPSMSDRPQGLRCLVATGWVSPPLLPEYQAIASRSA